MVNFISSTTNDEEHPSSAIDSYVSKEKFSPGWARRPKQGSMYGPKNMEPFSADIKRMYEEGEADKANKKGPAQMLEHLRAAHPTNYQLPSENDIRVEINKLQTQKKKNTSGNHFSINEYCFVIKL